MRSLISLALGAVLVLTLGVGSVLAAGPDHQTLNGTDTDPNFCGTGEAVDVTFKGVLNGWDDRAFGHIARTWTNPVNGAGVVESFSGGGKLAFIDDGNGAYTIVTFRVGQPLQLRQVGGGLLGHDVGRVAFYDHFDASDNYLGTDVVVIGGPHPFLVSETDLYCQIMIEALGL